MGERRYSSIILHLGTWWRRVLNITPRLLYPGERSLRTLRTGGLVVPEPVWTLLSRGKSFSPAGNGAPGLQPIARGYTDLAISVPKSPAQYISCFIPFTWAEMEPISVTQLF
jgi:hypothetical protein